MPEKPSPPENYFQFERLLAALARHNVDFAVVGGVAVSLNGFVRATDDVDILVHEAPDNVRKLLHCLSQWGEGWARELSPEDYVVGGQKKDLTQQVAEIRELNYD